ncbi:uncharacterized protein LOC121972875 [Zingiber officinale]|uniref:uncharacterized protein LOC121972875 n=1 Tax=Zingiber officinale TaxID=94328 RepID=UPI001C4AF9E9|nr:uncharacterized protein LOC121972875 [Zingiber officinale]
MIGRGGGVTRLKQHLVGGYPNVSNCPKVSQEVRRAMKEELDGRKTLKYKQQQERELVDSRSSKEPIYDEMEGRGEVPNDEDFLTALSASRTQYDYEQNMQHRSDSGASGSDSTTASTLGRSASVRITSTQGANNTYYRSMVSNIQKSGPGIQPPTAYEIVGPYLDEQVEEIKTWILSCKKQWSLYGVTLMCDGWTGPTRMSIINFLLYCNRKVIFHKSIDATTDYHDAPYIFRLMDSVVHEIGAEHIVQVITDNGANFKRAGEMLEQRYR